MLGKEGAFWVAVAPLSQLENTHTLTTNKLRLNKIFLMESVFGDEKIRVAA